VSRTANNKAFTNTICLNRERLGVVEARHKRRTLARWPVFLAGTRPPARQKTRMGEIMTASCHGSRVTPLVLSNLSASIGTRSKP
jgi:hypothetical protein